MSSNIFQIIQNPVCMAIIERHNDAKKSEVQMNMRKRKWHQRKRMLYFIMQRRESLFAKLQFVDNHALLSSNQLPSKNKTNDIFE